MKKNKLFPYAEENLYDNSICARCGSRDKLGRLKTNRDNFTFGDKGKGLCENCMKEIQKESIEGALKEGAFKIPVDEAEGLSSGEFDREVAIVRTKESKKR